MRNVIVTGGSRGLGLAISRRLAAGGYRAIAIARRETPELSEAVAESQAGGLVFTRFDLNDIAAMPSLTKSLRSQYGPIYGLVNNAGLGAAGLLAAMPLSEIEQLIRLNTLSPIALTRQVVRSMLAQGEGRIVNMSSIVAAAGYNGLSVYSATKAALTGFTRSLARELGRVGITVNAVAPGFIETAMTESLHSEDREKIARRSALQRM